MKYLKGNSLFVTLNWNSFLEALSKKKSKQTYENKKKLLYIYIR